MRNGETRKVYESSWSRHLDGEKMQAQEGINIRRGCIELFS